MLNLNKTSSFFVAVKLWLDARKAVKIATDAASARETTKALRAAERNLLDVLARRFEDELETAAA